MCWCASSDRSQNKPVGKLHIPSVSSYRCLWDCYQRQAAQDAVWKQISMLTSSRWPNPPGKIIYVSFSFKTKTKKHENNTADSSKFSLFRVVAIWEQELRTSSPLLIELGNVFILIAWLLCLMALLLFYSRCPSGRPRHRWPSSTKHRTSSSDQACWPAPCSAPTLWLKEGFRYWLQHNVISWRYH